MLRRTAVLIAVVALVAPGTASAAGQFPTMQAGFTQELYGTASSFLGGVAFAPDGDPWVDGCVGSGGGLFRFDTATTSPVNGSNVHPQVAGSPFASNAGCGLTNHPNGSLYSNTYGGVSRLNGSTGAPIGAAFGPGGDALGIAPDPQTGRLIYVGGDGTLQAVDPALTTNTVFSTVTQGKFVDGIAFDPTGNFLFTSNRTDFTLTIVRRNGTLVQNVPLTSEPDGISFHASAPKFVLVNNTDGTMTRLNFPGDDFTQTATKSVFASGGFRGDLTQVGSDGCVYLTQDGTRYDNGTVAATDSLVRVCGGFDPPPGVGGKISARGTLSDTTAGSVQLSAANDCTPSLSTKAFIVKWAGGTKSFTKNSVTSSTCSNDGSLPASPAGFNKQVGQAAGKLQDGSNATISWTFKDGGTGGAAADKVQLTIKNAGGTTIETVNEQSAGALSGTAGGVWTFTS